jgi:hypothetical protein
MSSSTSPSRSSLLNLDDLEADSAPTFVIKVGAYIVNFELLFCNESFRRAGLRETVLADGRQNILFRSWAQTVGMAKPKFEFAGREWTATVAGTKEDWKVVQAVPSEVDARGHHTWLPTRKAQSRRLSGNCLKNTGRDSLRIPSTMIHTRYDSLRTMMDMSDVGVFEYSPEGKLIHANDAWYRLR